MTQTLRTHLLKRRNSVPALQRCIRARHAAHHLSHWSALGTYRNIGCYLGVKGELPTQSIIEALWRKEKRVYLPLLHTSGEPSLHFLPYTPGSPMGRNRFGIPEPIYNAHLERPAPSLDLVLMPLLGFDLEGSRLGMGGGYYDRTFAFTLHQHELKRRPFLMGVAMQCQQTGLLQRQPWDVPLDAVLTENGIRIFR